MIVDVFNIFNKNFKILGTKLPFCSHQKYNGITLPTF